MLKPVSEAAVAAAAEELEQMIIYSAAEYGVDLDDPRQGIFPEQREQYRRWMRAVLPVAFSLVDR